MAHKSMFDSNESFPNWNTSVSSSEISSLSDVIPIRKSTSSKPSKKSATDLVQGGVNNWSMSRSASGKWSNEHGGQIMMDYVEKVQFKPAMKRSASDLIRESYAPFAVKKSELETVESFEFPSTVVDSEAQANPTSAQDKGSETIIETSLKDHEVGLASTDTLPSKKETMEKPNGMVARKEGLEKIPLPQCAASFYTGRPTQITEVAKVCASITKLNQYLSARKSDVQAGVPGKFLHAVIGPEISDVGTIASTISYAFYLNETANNSEFCTLPVINMKRSDLNMHTEIKWLLGSCCIDQSSLVFIDEIDLSYYDLFGSLKLVLLNGNKLPAKQEALKEDLVEIFNCKQVNGLYPWVETVTVGDEECSSCTLIAEKFVTTSPEILGGLGFSRLLLAGILLDTGNLINPECTSKDKYMATLVLKGAGRFGCSGLFQILKYKKFDITELKVKDILRKDFKKWTRVAGKPDVNGSRLSVSHIGMSSIAISIREFLSHESSASEDIVLFQQSEKLRLLMVVSGYYDTQKNFKREILVSADTPEHMRNLLNFFNSNSSQLPLKVISQPGLREELRAFEVDNKITSRKTIERLLEEFGGTTARRS